MLLVGLAIVITTAPISGAIAIRILLRARPGTSLIEAASAVAIALGRSRLTTESGGERRADGLSHAKRADVR